MKAFYDKQPSNLEAVGNGSYIYRWNIEEVIPEQSGDNAWEEKASQWKCEEVTVWLPITSDKVIEAVIREKYTASAELSLVNKFNAYQQGLDVASSVVGEYTDYLAFVAEVKRTVREVLGEKTTVIPTNAALAPRQADIARLLALTINTMSLTDDEALQVKSVYPEWEAFVGKELKKDMKIQDGGKLWKVLQVHTVQEQYRPGKGTESLYVEIVESHAGTQEDPIPYGNNMELFKGKYYTQDGAIYLCTRDTGAPVYNPLAELVGIYVKLVQ